MKMILKLYQRMMLMFCDEPVRKILFGKDSVDDCEVIEGSESNYGFIGQTIAKIREIQAEIDRMSCGKINSFDNKLTNLENEFTEKLSLFESKTKDELHQINELLINLSSMIDKLSDQVNNKTKRR